MAITGNIQRFFGTVKDVITPVAGAAGRTARKAATKTGKAAIAVGNKTLDGIEAAGKIDKRALINTAKERTGKAVDFTLGSGKRDPIGTFPQRTKFKEAKEVVKNGVHKTTGVELNSGLNLLDEIGTHVRGTAEAAYRLGKGSQYDIKLGANKSIKLNTGLFQASDSSLIGVKATGLGTAGLMAASTLSGVGQAGTKFNQDRQGYKDGQVQGHAPQQYQSAYQNNGGATGDLVFALNNLRHGGQI